MGDLKYVMVRDNHSYIPVIFADSIAHITMAELVTAHKDCKSFRVVSAGFIHMNDTVCYGNSTTLKINSRQEDSEIILVNIVLMSPRSSASPSQLCKYIVAKTNITHSFDL